MFKKIIIFYFFRNIVIIKSIIYLGTNERFRLNFKICMTNILKNNVLLKLNFTSFSSISWIWKSIFSFLSLSTLKFNKKYLKLYSKIEVGFKKVITPFLVSFRDIFKFLNFLENSRTESLFFIIILLE